MTELGWTPTDESGSCLYYTPYGEPYEEISCLYPILKPTYMSWEFKFPFIAVYEWMLANPMAIVGANVGYCFMIWLLPKWMEKRDSLQWKTSLAMWNIFLSVFSLIGWFRLSCQLAHNLYYYGMWGQLCYDPESLIGPGTTGIWGMFFALSKVPEFIDTYFIIIHKKKLIFLHWYHHITASLCAWYSFVSKSPTALFLGQMNYGVHAIMYFYYFLMAIKSKPKWFNPKIITFLQIAQMWVGVFISFAAFGVMYREGDKCWSKKETNWATMLMYGSYAILFMRFFFKRYEVKASKKSD